MLRATLAYVVGDLGSAARMAEESVALEPDRESPWRAVALATFGSARYWTGGDTERAVAALEEAVSPARPGVNSLATLRSLGMLAIMSLELCRRDEAARWVERADEVRERESLEEYPTGTYGLAAKAQLLAAAGDVAGALEASERAHVLGARSGVRPYLLYALTVMASIVATARGAAEARELLREARAVAAACSDPGALAPALDDAERRVRGRTEPGPADRDYLSERELAVLRLLPTQLTFAEIGSELYVSKNTVRTHAQSIYRKLGVDSRADAVAAARRDRLRPPFSDEFGLRFSRLGGGAHRAGREDAALERGEARQDADDVDAPGRAADAQEAPPERRARDLHVGDVVPGEARRAGQRPGLDALVRDLDALGARGRRPQDPCRGAGDGAAVGDGVSRIAERAALECVDVGHDGSLIEARGIRMPLPGRRSVRQGPADLPVVAERIADAPDPPSVPLVHRSDDRRPRGDRAVEQRVGVVDGQDHPHGPAAERSPSTPSTVGGARANPDVRRGPHEDVAAAEDHPAASVAQHLPLTGSPAGRRCASAGLEQAQQHSGAEPEGLHGHALVDPMEHRRRSRCRRGAGAGRTRSP